MDTVCINSYNMLYILYNEDIGALFYLYMAKIFVLQNVLPIELFTLTIIYSLAKLSCQYFSISLHVTPKY